MRKIKANYVTCGMFLCVIFGFMFLAIYSFASNKIDKLKRDENGEREIKIDWENLYPFESEVKKETKTRTNRLKTLYEYVKNKCEDYSSRNLFVYYSLIDFAKRYDNAVKWNVAYVSDYNAVVKLPDGYLTTYTQSVDVTENAISTIELAEFCRERGIEFFYANLPTKICISEDKNISGVLDFANQNADRFLEMIGEAGVRYYDFRKLLHEDGMNHHEAFYVTDHHWKAETGLWAARHLLKILRDDYDWNVNPDVLNPDRFDYVIYPSWFLGSQGKKVRLSRTHPDDFTMIYPKFETNLHYEIPSAGINTSGDFTITYDMNQIEPKDYYGKIPSSAYNHGRRPLTRINNALIANDKKIQQENTARKYSKKIQQENTARKYSKKIQQENTARKYSKKIQQENIDCL